MNLGLLAYLLIPLASALAIPFAAKFRNKLADVLANVTLLAGLINISFTLFNPANISYPFSGIAEDGFSLLMIFVIYLVALCVAFFSSYFIDKDSKINRVPYYSLILTSVSAMCGIVTAGDFFTLYIFAEVLTVATAALLTSDEEAKGLEAAIKYFLLTLPASLFILFGIAFLILTAGTLSFGSIKIIIASGLPVGALIFSVSLILLGFLIKTGAAPFHAWAADACEGSYAPVSAYLSGIVTMISGAYVVIKICILLRLFEPKACPAAEILMFLGMLSIAAGALGAMRQKEFKRMLAFSGLSQTGYIILAAGLGTPLAILGAVFHLVNHAAFSTVLFLNSASLEKGAGTTDMRKLGGLEHSMPWTSRTSVVALLSAAGVPPLSGFWSKLLIVIALWDGGAKTYAVMALLFSTVTLAYFLTMQRKVFFGAPTEASRNAREIRPAMLVPVAGLCLFIAALGVFFPFVYSYLVETIAARIVL